MPCLKRKCQEVETNVLRLVPQTVGILGISGERVHDEQIAQSRTDMGQILKENWKRIRRAFLLSISKICSELTK
jgi:hypothetical protein